MDPIDYIIVFVYLTVIMLIGLWFWAKRERSIDKFMVARGSMRGWVLGCSLVVTNISSIAFMGIPAKAYAADWGSYIHFLAAPIVALFVVPYIVPFYRKMTDASSFSHLGRRFGRWATLYSVVCYSLVNIVWIAAILYLISLVLTSVTNWDSRNAIVIVGVIVTAYTCIGGLKAVIWTDVVQCVVLLFGSIFTLFYLFSEIPGGVNGFIEVAMADNKFGLGSFSFDFTQATYWVLLFVGVMRNLNWFAIGPEYVQRYIAAKSDREAKKSVIFSSVLSVIITGLFFLIGTAFYVFYQVNPELAADGIDHLCNDAVLPHFIATTLPIGIKGLMIAAIMSAAMSSIDSGLNVIGLIIMEHVFKPLTENKPVHNLKEKTWRTLYLVPVVSGIMAIGIAFLFREVENILDEWFRLEALFGSGILGLFLLGFLSKKADWRGALAGVIVGTLVLAWMVWSPSWEGPWAAFRNPLHSFMTIIVGTFTTLGVGLVVTKFTGAAKK